MSAEQQDFEKLGRLLKLKRYEQPHPRYFNDFSSQVIQRIKAGETPAKAGWIERLWEHFAARPGYTGMIATTACGLLVAAMIYTEHGGASNVADTSPFVAPAIAANSGSLQPVSLFGASTNPFAPGQSTAIAPGDSLFNIVPQLNVEKVSWPVGNK